MTVITWEEARELARGLGSGLTHESLSHKLPFEAYMKGWGLHFELPAFSPDPVFLTDRNGRTLHEWDYVPSLAELDEVCRRLLGEAVGEKGK